MKRFIEQGNPHTHTHTYTHTQPQVAMGRTSNSFMQSRIILTEHTHTQTTPGLTTSEHLEYALIDQSGHAQKHLLGSWSHRHFYELYGTERNNKKCKHRWLKDYMSDYAHSRSLPGCNDDYTCSCSLTRCAMACCILMARKLLLYIKLDVAK
jgi:hypothetical protein